MRRSNITWTTVPRIRAEPVLRRTCTRKACRSGVVGDAFRGRREGFERLTRQPRPRPLAGLGLAVFEPEHDDSEAFEESDVAILRPGFEHEDLEETFGLQFRRHKK